MFFFNFFKSKNDKQLLKRYYVALVITVKKETNCFHKKINIVVFPVLLKEKKGAERAIAVLRKKTTKSLIVFFLSFYFYFFKKKKTIHKIVFYKTASGALFHLVQPELRSLGTIMRLLGSSLPWVKKQNKKLQSIKI